MASVTETLQLEVAAPRIWDVIGNFGGLPDWHPAAESCVLEGEGIGSVRIITVIGGLKIKEQLLGYKPGESYRYSILEGPLPVKNYVSVLSIAPDAGEAGTIVTWESSFDADGVPDEIAEGAIRDIYMAGLIALKKHFDEA